MRRPRAMIADDHKMLADALRGILEPRCEVVGIVANGRELLRSAVKLQPDLIILDIAMPELNGLDAARQLRNTMPKVKLIFMTMNEDPYLAAEALRAGASAFLHKQGAAFELTDAVEQVLRGKTYITRSAAQALDKISLEAPGSRNQIPEPTARQREVIQLLAEGHSMKEVASALKITKRTVAAHKYAVMEQLQLKTNAELVQYAIRNHIISI